MSRPVSKLMYFYQVFFSVNEHTDVDEFLERVHEFMKEQLKSHRAAEYRLLKIEDKATFPELTDFQMIVGYRSERDRTLGFEGMKEIAGTEPHATLIKGVSDFRVAFSVEQRFEHSG